ncbi:MAG: hypothetical protein H6813_01375 [Phycisphaeraceae bacterium]|nr:hypothetical protein [Phycisphaeraceae bacterium]
MPHRRLLTIPLALLLTLHVGCASTTPSTQRARRYPSGATHGGTLPIQVIVDGRRVEFTNTTGTVFGPSELWLNQWYSVAIDGLTVGETVSIPIARFIDEHGQQMRGGGFFATEAPERIVYAELRTGDTLRGMPVVEPNTTSR